MISGPFHSETSDRGGPFARLLSEWRAGGSGSPALLMGIVNVTPDSFSEGGLLADPADAITHGKALAAAGAAIVDVGGESTRPSAHPVDADEEMRRVLPVIGGLARTFSVPDESAQFAGTEQRSPLISVDTFKAVVADAALAAGAAIVNDIRGLQGDPALADTAARYGAGVVAMHNPGLLGASSGTAGDPVAACLRFFARSAEIASKAGIRPDRLVFDPGFGFGKTVEQSLELLARMPELVACGFPILVGTSRKSFLGKLLGRDLQDRLIGTVVTHSIAAMAGAAVLRVHDVAPHCDAVRMVAAVRSSGANCRVGDAAP